MFKVTNPSRLRYQPNRPSFLFCLLAIVCNVGALITAYTSTTIKPNIVIGLDVVINIIFLLMCFMASEKTKAYSYYWGNVVIVLGIVEFARVLMVPLVFLIKKQYEIGGFIMNVLFLIGAGVCLILAGIVCKERALILKNHLENE